MSGVLRQERSLFPGDAPAQRFAGQVAAEFVHSVAAKAAAFVVTGTGEVRRQDDIGGSG